MSVKRYLLVALCFILFCEFFLRVIPDSIVADYSDKFKHLYWHLDMHADIFGGLKDQETIFDSPDRGRIEAYSHEFSIDKPAGTKRIVCLGSSSTVGTGSSDLIKKAYPRCLERFLHSAGCADYEVFNAGIGGLDLVALHIYLKEIVLGIDPDIVILYFGGNGAQLSSVNFYSKALRLVAERPYIQTYEQLLLAMDLNSANEDLFRSYYFCMKNSKLFYLAKHYLDMFRRYMNRYQKTWTTEEEEVALYREKTAAIRALCRERDIPLVLIPEIAYKKDGAYRTLIFDSFQAIADEHDQSIDVHFIDLLDGRFPEVDTYFVEQSDYEVHFNDAGYAWLAHTIGEYLLASGLVSDTIHTEK